ncbi:MAG: YncE family protein, partial [Fibrobacterota bacterium]
MLKVICVVVMSIHSVHAQQVIPQMKHRLLLADEGNQKIHYVNQLDTTKNWSISVVSNRDMQLVGDNRLMVSNGSGYEEYDLLTHQQTKKVAIGSQIQSSFRITNQETYVGIDGTVPKISIIDVASGKSKSTISIQPSVTLRIIRPTAKRTFLVGGKDAGMVYEIDSTGKKIWEANVGGSPYQTVRMPNGNTIVSTGYGAQIVVVDKNAKIIRTYPVNPKDASLTSVKPNFFGGFQVLENGNIVVTNWQGHGSGMGTNGVQLLEFDSTGVIVGGWKQNASYISSLHGVLVLDNLDTKV